MPQNYVKYKKDENYEFKWYLTFLDGIEGMEP
jgi:hypothetical protein